jgi:histidinol-phosphate phosphatase family protein
MGRQAVFLDRDGTVLEDTGYLADPASVRLVSGAIEALRALRERGYLLVLVSNQSGVGRGLITPAQADAVHRRLLVELESHGLALDDVRYCPHAPTARCPCRKPEPGMILASADALEIDLDSSFLVGDSPDDAGAGQAAGVRTVILGTDARDWEEAVRTIDEWSRGSA